MNVTSKDIDDLALIALGRRLSPAELADVTRQCATIGLRQGEDVFLLGLIQHRDLVSRLERIAKEAAKAQSMATALKRLRGWIAFAAVAATALGVGLYDEAFMAGYAERDRLMARDLAWTETEAGRGARLLFESGIIPPLLACSLPGWSQAGSHCVPGVDPISRRTIGIPNRLPEASQ